ncbi:MAG: mltG [Rhodoglobus sp.]|nr:mltG [Rhodoglobus sp.]
MANEPSWDDIFKPTPAAGDPEPGQAAAQPAPAQDDPFAALFGTPEPPALVEPAAPAPSTAPPVSAAAPNDSFSGLFGAQPETYPPTQAYPTVSAEQPMSRREARENEGRSRDDSGSGRGGSGRGGSGRGSSGRGGSGGKPKRRLLWLKITLPIVLVLGAVGGVAAFGWFNYNEQVRALLGIPLPTDYDGTGNGEEVVVPIRSGDIGSDVAVTLHEAGVTLTYDAVYDYLVENPDISFLPGNWRLQKEMSAASAVAALQDTDNKVTDKLLITEGTVLPNALETIAATTGLPIEDVQAAAADVAAYGLPAQATTLEGFLFPATYELDGTETAQAILQKMVDTMMEHLDAAGVAPEQRWDVIRLASMVQREAGSNLDDFGKVARVFQNRIDQGINLESDATVAYGTGRLDSVWTEPEERADPSNLYNTYANPGLPVGPIGLPGDDAINAALHPTEGPWLFFVPINLATGETVFSETVEEHDAAVEQLHAWCDESAENATYCE